MAGNENTKNTDSPLFKRLTRLFSGPIINYRTQNTRQLRRRRLDKYAQTFKDVAGQKFERTGYNPLENFSNYNMSTQSRLVRYSDFEQMEYTPELASALDIFADEMTTFNVYNRMLKIQCQDEEIKQMSSTFLAGQEQCASMVTFIFIWTLTLTLVLKTSLVFRLVK